MIFFLIFFFPFKKRSPPRHNYYYLKYTTQKRYRYRRTKSTDGFSFSSYNGGIRGLILTRDKPQRYINIIYRCISILCYIYYNYMIHISHKVQLYRIWLYIINIIHSPSWINIYEHISFLQL